MTKYPVLEIIMYAKPCSLFRGTSCLTTFACLTLLASAANASPMRDVPVRTRGELQQAVALATPGTRILIAPGTYRGGLSVSNLRGEPGRPIILDAQNAQQPPIIQGGGTCLHLIDPCHVELRNLVIQEATGNGLNVDDGGSYDSPAHHITLHNLHVRNIGPDGNRDGIKLSGVNHFRIEECTVERWGGGGSAIDMVGCHEGDIGGCTFRYRDDVQANGIQSKGGSARVTIHHCRFENVGSRSVNIGGSTGAAYFRPPKPGYEAKDITVEDCIFIGSAAPIAFVGVDGAVVRYNTIYRPSRWVMRILQESRGPGFVPCRHGQFTNNIVVFRTDELRTVVNVGSGTASDSFTFANNYWYRLDQPRQSDRISLPVSEQNGHYGIDPQFMDEEQLDLRLKATSPVRNAGAR